MFGEFFLETRGVVLKINCTYYRKIYLGLFLLWILGLVACKPEIKAGLYSGNISDNRAESSSVEPVQSELVFGDPGVGDLVVRNASKVILLSAQLKWNQNNRKVKIRIESLGLFLELAPLNFFKKDDRMFCYQGFIDFEVALCFSHDQFNLSVTSLGSKNLIFAVDGRYDSQQVPLEMETPQAFTRSIAIQNAYKKSFDQAIEYQVLVEFKKKAEIAWMNLLPHLNFRDLIGISSLLPRTIANFVADFVPFLLPTRWYQKREAQDLFDAEKLTFDILRADLAYNIESMAYSLDRDQMNDKFYKEQREKILKAYQHLTEIGGASIGVLGAVIDELEFRLNLVDNFMQQDKNRLENAIDLEKTALAFQMGYNNPKVVDSFNVEDNCDEIDRAEVLSSEEISNLALGRSLELKQMDHLISNAEYQKKEWYFNWADPDVGAASAISLSIIPNISKANAVIGEITQRRNRVAAFVKMNSTNAVINYNRALELYKITQKSLSRLELRENQIYEDIQESALSSSIHTTGAAAQYALNTYFQFKLKQNDAITAYRVAGAQIRRVLFSYFYEGFDSKT